MAEWTPPMARRVEPAGSFAGREWGDGTEVDLGRAVPVGIDDLREDIAQGQYVARYTLEGLGDDGWRTLSRGTRIGYWKLDRFEAVRVRRVRLTVEDAVARAWGGLYRAAAASA